MKIAFLGDALDLQYAGIHFYTKNIIQQTIALDKQNEYFILRPKAGNEYPNATEIISPVRSFIPLHQKVRSFFNIPFLMQKHKIDVVIEPCHFGPFNLPKSTKKITVIHDITPVLFPEYHISSSHFFHKLLLPGITKRADHLIVNSEHTKQDLIQYYPQAKGKTTVVHLGKEDIFKPKTDPTVLKKYGINKDYLLFVGTLEPRKNLMVLLQAFEELKKSDATHKNLQLVFVGKKGWKIEAFLEAIELSPFKNDIVITDYVERKDLPVLYSMSKIFVYPSLYEGFGLPVLEAMACGTAVVSSNASSLPEVGGDAALYFSPTNTNELLVQLQKLLSDDALRQQCKTASLVQAAKFSWEKAGRETVEILRGV